MRFESCAAGRTRTHTPIHVERSTDRVELCACVPRGLPIAKARKRQEDLRVRDGVEWDALPARGRCVSCSLVWCREILLFA